jgi:drug/metabolite transporter (DMT)-like permease
MKLTATFKGYFFAVLALFAMSNVYIFSKAALQELTLSQFGVYWFSFALIWISILALFRRTFSKIAKLPRRVLGLLFLVGVLDVSATYFFFKAIQTISNPSLVAFIGNISPALVILLGIWFFKERFSTLETLGVLLALAGAFIISYKGNLAWKDMFIYGSQFVLFSSIISATNTVLIKHNIAKVNAIMLTLNRILFLLLFFVLTFPYKTSSFEISPTALNNVIIGSFLGPFLTAVSGYMVYQYLPISRKAIVDSMRGMVVMIGAYLYFGSFPSSIAILGGSISIVGVLFIALGKLRLKEKP